MRKIYLVLIIAFLAMSLNGQCVDCDYNRGYDQHEGVMGKGWEEGKHRKGKRRGSFLKKIGVSDDILKQIRDIRKSTKEEMKSLFEKAKPIRDKIHAELVKPDPDKSVLATYYEQIASVKKEKSLIQHKSMEKVMLLLTVDQRKEMIKHRKGRKGRKGKRGRKGHR